MEWKYPIAAESLQVNDLDHNDLLEVVVGSKNHDVHVLNYKGELKWKLETKHKINQVKVEDTDGDDDQEIIAGSVKSLYLLDGKEITWEKKLGSPVYDIHVTDLEGNGVKDIVVGSHIHAYIFDAQGKLKEKWNMGTKEASVEEVYSAPLYGKEKNENIILGYSWIPTTGVSKSKSKVETFQVTTEEAPERETEIEEPEPKQQEKSEEPETTVSTLPGKIKEKDYSLYFLGAIFLLVVIFIAYQLRK